MLKTRKDGCHGRAVNSEADFELSQGAYCCIGFEAHAGTLATLL